MENQSEEIFRKQLLALIATAKKQGMSVSREQVVNAFEGMELNDSKMELIYDYLKNSKITVGEENTAQDVLLDEEKNYLDEYMRELKDLPEYTERERERICLEAFGGDKNAKEKLLHIFLPRVVEISRLYAGQGVLIEDLIGEGNVAVAAALDMFDCIEKPDEIEGFLSKMIMDAMEQSISDELALSQKDEELVTKVNRIAEAAEQLAEDLRRDVTPEELAAETELSEDEIREILAVAGQNIKGIEGPKEEA